MADQYEIKSLSPISWAQGYTRRLIPFQYHPIISNRDDISETRCTQYFYSPSPEYLAACCRNERQGEPRRSSLERRRVRLRRNSALIPRSLLRGASFNDSKIQVVTYFDINSTLIYSLYLICSRTS